VIANLFAAPWIIAVLADWITGLSMRKFWFFVALPQAILGIFAVIFWVMLAIFATTESSTLTTRQQQSHLHTARWLKPLNVLVRPGGARGRLLVLVLALAMALMHLLVTLQISGVGGGDLREASRIFFMHFSVISLVLLWLALGDLIFMFVRCRPLMKRIALFTSLLVWIIGMPILALAVNGGHRLENEVLYWVPVGGSYELADDAFSGKNFAIVILGSQIVLGAIAFIYLGIRVFFCWREEVKAQL
jgi:hypothetical protein